MPPKMNPKGQKYPWTDKEKNFAMYESGRQMESFLSDYVGICLEGDEKKQEKKKYQDISISDPCEDNPNITDDVMAGKYAGGSMLKGSGRIQLGDVHQGYSVYVTPEQEPVTLSKIDEMAGISKDITQRMRDQYKGLSDPKSMHLNERSNEIADWIDLQTSAFDPRTGDIVEAEFRSPALKLANIRAGDAPRFGTMGVEGCLDILEHGDANGGKGIYDDYMTMMSSGAREAHVQFRRQKMEADGWDAQKEATYLGELKAEHEKTITAFENLANIDDRGQYDKALNNRLDEMIGKDITNNRGATPMIGYMKGENRAIDMGYDSTHLHVLGRIGQAEEVARKKSAALDRAIATTTVDSAKADYIEQKEKCDEYLKEVAEIKESVWSKKVNSKDEMEAADRQVDEFFAAHQEKYGELQRWDNYNKENYAYNRDVAMNPPTRQQEFVRPEIPSTEGLDRSMKQFSVARFALFRSESEEHKELRSAAEKVKEKIEKLKNGKVHDEYMDKERDMTDKEYSILLDETRADIEALSKASDKYIDHATNHGKSTPSTSAGKARLEGARGIKEQAEQFREALNPKPVLEAEAAGPEREAEANVKGGKSVPQSLARLDKEVDKFKQMNGNDFHDTTPESGAFGMNEWEYQAAKVVAASTVKTAYENGEIGAGEISGAYAKATREVAKDKDFAKWVKEAHDDPAKRSKFQNMTADEISDDFVNDMTKGMEKAQQKEQGPKSKDLDANKKVNNGQVRNKTEITGPEL